MFQDTWLFPQLSYQIFSNAKKRKTPQCIPPLLWTLLFYRNPESETFPAHFILLLPEIRPCISIQFQYVPGHKSIWLQSAHIFVFLIASAPASSKAFSAMSTENPSLKRTICPLFFFWVSSSTIPCLIRFLSALPCCHCGQVYLRTAHDPASYKIECTEMFCVL